MAVPGPRRVVARSSHLGCLGLARRTEFRAWLAGLLLGDVARAAGAALALGAEALVVGADAQADAALEGVVLGRGSVR